MDSNPIQPAPASGINLYGYLTSNVGLGVAARNTMRMLQANQVPVAPIDVHPGGGGSDDTLTELIAENAGRAPYGISLFHLNPDRLRYLISPFSHAVDFEGRANACVPFWEAPRLPRAWLATLSAMDVILAPTLFVRDAVLADFPDANVLHYPQTVFLPDGVAANRQRFGLPTDKVVFVASFALASDIERKNPWAIIEAFKRAFGARDEAVLALKVNNPDATGHGAGMQRLRAIAAETPGVMLLEDSMTYAAVLSFYASCDVLVSLHRSEGLGLNMLEAMSLGVPVLATGWSGNMDFTTDECAALVKYSLVDIDVPRSSPYHVKNMGLVTQWAEPDVDDAAQWMRRLAEDSALRARLGEAGLRVARERQTRYLEGGMVRDLAAALEGWSGDRRQRARMRRLEATYVPDYAARIWRGLMRRVRAVAGG